MNSDSKDIKKLIINQSLELDCGKTIKDFPLAYETYGNLNKDKNNAILTFHALTGDQFATNINPITKRGGGGLLQLDLVKQSIQINFL